MKSGSARGFSEQAGFAGRAGRMDLFHGVALLGIAASLLPSVFLAGAPLALFGGAAMLALFPAARFRWRDRGWVLCAASITAGFIGAHLYRGLPDFEVVKAGVGMFLFLATLVTGKGVLKFLVARRGHLPEWFAVLLCVAFALDYLGIFSFKEAGLVSWFQTGSFRAAFDARPSGIYSEPSWFALATNATAFFVAERRRRAWQGVVTLCLGCSVLSGSSTGLLLSSLLLLRVALSSGSEGGEGGFVLLRQFAVAVAIVVVGICAIPFASAPNSLTQ